MFRTRGGTREATFGLCKRRPAGGCTTTTVGSGRVAAQHSTGRGGPSPSDRFRLANGTCHPRDGEPAGVGTRGGASRGTRARDNSSTFVIESPTVERPLPGAGNHAAGGRPTAGRRHTPAGRPHTSALAPRHVPREGPTRGQPSDDAGPPRAGQLRDAGSPFGGLFDMNGELFDHAKSVALLLE